MGKDDPKFTTINRVQSHLKGGKDVLLAVAEMPMMKLRNIYPRTPHGRAQKKNLITEYGVFDESHEIDEETTLDNIRYHAWTKYPDVYNKGLEKMYGLQADADCERLRNLLIRMHLNPEADPEKLPDSHLLNRLGGADAARSYAQYAEHYLKDRELDKKHFLVEKDWRKLPLKELLRDVPEYLQKTYF